MKEKEENRRKDRARDSGRHEKHQESKLNSETLKHEMHEPPIEDKLEEDRSKAQEGANLVRQLNP